MKIGVFLPNWVGDSVMATPTLRALSGHFGPRAKIVGVMRPYLAPLFHGLPWVNEYLFYERGRCAKEYRLHRLLLELRRHQFDKVIILTNSLSTAAFAWLGGAVERIGYDRYARGLLLTHRLLPPRNGRELVPISPVDYYLELASVVGCEHLERRVELATTGEEEAAADRVLNKLGLAAGRPLAVFNTGGAYGATKHWPADSFVELARRMVHTWDMSVLVLCGPSEREAAAYIVQRAAHPHVTSLANERLSIGLTKACVRRSALMVSTDSGPRHLAAAFGVPTVALFGPTDPRWSVNYNPWETVVRLHLACSPCAKRLCPLRHHDCMRQLSVDLVFDAVRTLLSQAADRSAA